MCFPPYPHPPFPTRRQTDASGLASDAGEEAPVVHDVVHLEDWVFACFDFLLLFFAIPVLACLARLSLAFALSLSLSLPGGLGVCDTGV